MATWRKVIVSGSDAHLSAITSSVINNVAGTTSHKVVVVDTDKLVDVSNAVSNLSDRRVLESPFRVLASVVEDTSLLVDVVEIEWLKLPALSELHILQPLDVNDQAVRLSLSDGLLNLEVSKLKHISKS